jgi:hypothetical protein
MNPMDLVPKKYQEEYDMQKHKQFEQQDFVLEHKPAAYIQFKARELDITISDQEAIRKKLEAYKTPIYMYDFETIKFAVPELPEV